MVTPRSTAVWVNATSATVVRWGPGLVRRSHLDSQVPAHHRSTGQVTAPGGERHGGTGPRAAGERHRLEHLRAFLTQVRATLPEDDLLLVGDGVVVERLAKVVRDADTARGLARRIEVRRHAPLTEGQLLAMLRRFAGAPPRRRRPRLAQAGLSA
jgi:hypothetical protein